MNTLSGQLALSYPATNVGLGVRLALGAQVRDIFGLIIGGGLRLALLGAALGLAGTWGIARLLRSLSPEFAASNPGLTLAVTALLLLVAFVACYLPARRATRVDPLAALRSE